MPAAVIGLDAAEWTLVETLMAEGRMPTLAGLRSQSAVWRLQDPDYRTGLVWEHFLTGKDAQASGRSSVVVFEPETYETYAVGARALPPFFAWEPPIGVLALDVPYVTLTAGTDDSVLITAPASIDTLADALIEGARRRAEAATWLIEKRPKWDLS